MTILAISFGDKRTTAVTLGNHGEPETIKLKEGATIQGMVCPSFVEFDQMGEPLNIGSRAWQASASGSNTVAWGSKRLIGLPFEEARKEFSHLDYPIERAPDGGVHIVAGPRCHTPTDIAAMILRKIKEDAENPHLNALNGPITKVVVSHPANFDIGRVQATKEAVKEAFPNVTIDTVPEPVAAALAYSVQFPPDRGSLIVCVIDLGAGTLDVVTAVLTGDANEIGMSPDPARGKANLGGIDIDDLILDWAIKEYDLTDFEQVRHGGEAAMKDLLGIQLGNLRRELEIAKIRLSRPNAKLQEIDVTYQGRIVTITLSKEKLEEILSAPLSQERLEEILGPRATAGAFEGITGTLVKGKAPEGISKSSQATETKEGEVQSMPSFLDVFRLIVSNSIALGGHKPEDIDRVLLVGGPMHMTCIRNVVKEIFINNPRVREELEMIDREGFPVNPMECVARGAALYAGGIIETVPVSGYDYAIPIVQVERRRKKYIQIAKLINIGDSLPIERSHDDFDIHLQADLAEVAITLIEGKQDETSPDKNRRVWLKKGEYYLYPAWDSRGQAFYTITLHAEKDEITCICHDKVTNKTYTFHKFNKQNGELLSEDKYIITEDHLPRVLIRENIEGVNQAIASLIADANFWLSQKHPPEEEQNRAEVINTMGQLQHLYADAPKPQRIKWVKDEEGQEIPEDEAVTDAWITVLGAAQRLLSLIQSRKITDAKLQSLRQYANYLFQESNDAKAKNDPEVESKVQEIEQALKRLPNKITDPEGTTDSDVTRNFAVAASRCEVLRQAIESAAGITLRRWSQSL